MSWLYTVSHKSSIITLELKDNVNFYRNVFVIGIECIFTTTYTKFPF